MTRLMIIVLVASFALTAVAAAAETAASDSRARLAAIFEQDPRAEPAEGRQVSAMRQQGGAAGWVGNWKGGRKHPPAGR